MIWGEGIAGSTSRVEEWHNLKLNRFLLFMQGFMVSFDMVRLLGGTKA